MSSNHPRYPTIQIHAQAKEKPPIGAPCNGCGVCCLLAPCPVSRLLLQHREGSCAALVWQDTTAQYRCGMLLTPQLYLRWLPALTVRPFIALTQRWLALDIGCDCDVELEQ